MTISTASVVQVADESDGWDNIAPTAGTWRNLLWEEPTTTEVTWGKLVGKFTFDFEKVVFKFTNLTPTIPANAQIVSAVLRGTATVTSTPAAFFSVIRTLATDGVWDPASAGPRWRGASEPTLLLNTDMDVTVYGVFLPVLADTAVTTTHRWAIRDNGAGRYLKAGQGVEIVTAGTLGFVDITLDRDGAVAVGDIWAEVYSQDANGLADTLLATSDVRPASAAPGAGVAPFRFAFTGPNRIALTPGQDIVVALAGDYPVSSSQHILVGWAAAGYAPGKFQLFGTGIGFDDQNYPMQRNFRAIPGTGFVIWIAPRFFAGIDYDTPELRDMLQQHILTSGYAQGDPLGFSVERSLLFFPAGDANRKWANFAHPTFEPVRLIVEWVEPPCDVAVADADSAMAILADGGPCVTPTDEPGDSTVLDDDGPDVDLSDSDSATITLGDDTTGDVTLSDEICS